MKSVIFALIGAACLCAAYAAAAEPAIPAEIITLANDEASKARAAMDNALADYPTARIRNVRATYSLRIEGGNKRLTFCGEINAKNKMGAYVGWALFAYLPEDGGSLLTENDPIGQYVLPRFCNNGTQVWLPADYTSAFTPTP